MTPVVAAKVKKESLLISSDDFRDSHITNLVLCWQVYGSVYVKFGSCGGLTTVARYETSPNII